MSKSFTTLVLILSTFVACSIQTPQPQNTSHNKKPDWIANPYKNGKTGAVGVANMHAKGFAFQRKVAITRALDELALQKGVTVSLKMEKKDTLKNNTAKVQMKTDSTYDTDSVKVTAHIEDVWRDNYTQELYVWLLLD